MHFDFGSSSLRVAIPNFRGQSTIKTRRDGQNWSQLIQIRSFPRIPREERPDKWRFFSVVHSRDERVIRCFRVNSPVSLLTLQPTLFPEFPEQASTLQVPGGEAICMPAAFHQAGRVMLMHQNRMGHRDLIYILGEGNEGEYENEGHQQQQQRKQRRHQ